LTARNKLPLQRRDAYRPRASGHDAAVAGAPPIRAEARAELLVLKWGPMFLCARPDGDLRAAAVSGEGFYRDDTRYLSEMRLTLGGTQPVLLSRSVEAGYRAVVDATNPSFFDVSGARVPQETLNVRRTLVVADRLYCQVELHNYWSRAVAVPLSLTLGADYADVFEIRGVPHPPTRVEPVSVRARRSGVAFARRGVDGCTRRTLIGLEPPAADPALDGEVARIDWTIELDPGAHHSLLVSVTPERGAEHRRPHRFRPAVRDVEEQIDQWVGSCTGIASDSALFENVIAASVRDLKALVTPVPGGQLPAAGIPWFVAPFGRDSLLTSHQCLLLNPALARDSLIALAAMQAQADDAWRDAEPGKILHELRDGELARAGLIPHTPYYGTADATPLFVMLAATYFRWTADLETLAMLRPALDAALEWIDRYGDIDGDGFVEYQRRSPAGLVNQGWKDSEDSIVHADGSLARGPIALVEVQGYVYLAKLRIADVYEALGEADRGRELRAQAKRLREGFNDAFWNPDEGTFALALDGAKRQVASVTSNPGHCLYCGIVDGEKADSLVARLMAPDMFSGWGVRTLSSESPAYNPMSYHNGSVWPHDNAIIAAGLKRYDFADETLRIATGIFDIAAQSRDFRLAELYCGFERSRTSEIVGYPVACMPQAWAAAAPLMLLQAILGITAHAPARRLDVIQPRLPEWVEGAELRSLRVGDAEVSLAFTRAGEVTGFSLLGQTGELTVTMAATPGTADSWL
jgi:glycogen debranching enzyme